MNSTIFSNRALSLQQSITKYQSELRVCDKEQAEEELHLAKIRTEVEAVTARIQMRADELALLRGNVDRPSELLNLLETGKYLPDGTWPKGRQRSSLTKTAVREKFAAEQALQAFLERTAADEDRDHVRLKELSDKQEPVEQRLTNIQSLRQMIEQAIQETRAEIAESECQEIVIRVEQLQGQIRELSHELALARQFLEDTIETGIVSLADWPELQLKVKRLLPSPLPSE